MASSYEEVFQAKSIIGMGKNYQNPEWSMDSKFFTVEMYTELNEFKTFKLYLGEIDDDIKFDFIISDSYKKKKSKIGKSKKIRERNLGWLEDETYRFYGDVDKSNKIRDCYVEVDNDFSLEIEPVSDLEDQELSDDLLDLEIEFPLREYTISDSSIYFTTYSDTRRIWSFTNYDNDDFDKFTYSSIGYLDNKTIKTMFDIPIVSISTSLNEDKLLIVCYNENQSDIMMLHKGDSYNNYNDLKIYDKMNIKKPIVEKMNYLYGILDPNDDKRYLLIARKQSSVDQDDSERKNLANVFVMNGNEVEGEFVMYRNMEDNVMYNNPEIQFHPQTNDIYFIDDVNGNKNLSYWNGKKIIRTSLELDNIMNFKFSPDGSYLLATTFVPEDLHVYKVVND